MSDTYPTIITITISSISELTAFRAASRPSSVSGFAVTMSMTLPANVGCDHTDKVVCHQNCRHWTHGHKPPSFPNIKFRTMWNEETHTSKTLDKDDTNKATVAKISTVVSGLAWKTHNHNNMSQRSAILMLRIEHNVFYTNKGKRFLIYPRLFYLENSP